MPEFVDETGVAIRHEPAGTPRQRALVWALMGLAYAAGMLTASTVAGAIGFLLVVGATVFVWRRYAGRELWVGMVVCGLLMCAALSTAAITESGCPSPGAKVVLKENKPPVECDEIVASYITMATLFGLLAAIGVAVPFARRRREAR